MKINSLKTFVQLIDTGSYSITADRIGLTQPAVSMQIKKLEDNFATDLIIKEEGALILTPAGKAVYGYSKDILDKWEKLVFEVENKKHKYYKNIAIGASTIPSEYILPDILAELSKDRPEIKSSIEVGDSAEMIELLDQKEVDLILVGYKPTSTKFEIIEIVEDQLKLIIPLEHPLAERDVVKMINLTEENFLIREIGSGTRKAMLSGFKRANLNINDLNIKCQLGSTEAVISAVQSGLGISFVSEFASSKAQQCGRIREISVEDINLIRKFYLAYNKNKKDDELIKKFIIICKKMVNYG